MGRILTLSQYFMRSLFFSLTGLIYLILALVYWNIFFAPAQGTPEIENYILIIGVFGIAISFFVTLSVTARANQAIHFPMVARLPSRVEYLTAVLLSSVAAATLLQLLVAALAMYRGPGLLWGRLFEVPPIWIATNIFTAVVAMHATDFVTAGWSRVYLFGLLGVILLGNTANTTLSNWVVSRFNSLTNSANRLGWTNASEFVNGISRWLGSREEGILSQLFSWLIWPFTAISEATITGYYNSVQALAPAVLMLYATVLFLLAADLFSGKDLEFIE